MNLRRSSAVTLLTSSQPSRNLSKSVTAVVTVSIVRSDLVSVLANLRYKNKKEPRFLASISIRARSYRMHFALKAKRLIRLLP